MTWKKLATMILALCLSAFTTALASGPLPIAVNDIVPFGCYEQDGDADDGSEPIEWQVLDIDGQKALLLSRCGLEAQAYDLSDEDATWETCTLRAWLNGEFLNAAFTEEQKVAILTTDVNNSPDQGLDGWNTTGGNDTQDKVFLLSCAEIRKYFSVGKNTISSISTRVSPTPCALEQGAVTYVNCSTPGGNPAGWWWLRSPGADQCSAAVIEGDGSLSFTINYSGVGCVRPALWVDLEAAGL